MTSTREAAIALFEILDQLDITYAVGGSFASSVHGLARATQDIDVVIDLSPHQIGDLHQALTDYFYADDSAMRLAVTRGQSFNAIHFDSGLKIDLFVASRHPLGADQLAHRIKKATTLLGGDPIEINIVSAEDILLAKLLWYQDGGSVSERQWNDLLNIVRVQDKRLNRDYLSAQATRLRVDDLLARLLS